jgi:hypothetical protein
MVSIDQVQRWYVIYSNIGHAVAGCGNGMVHTACGTLSFDNTDSTQTDRPKRICRKCRERLKVAELLQPENKHMVSKPRLAS